MSLIFIGVREDTNAGDYFFPRSVSPRIIAIDIAKAYILSVLALVCNERLTWFGDCIAWVYVTNVNPIKHTF